jgi:hypothetical protein
VLLTGSLEKLSLQFFEFSRGFTRFSNLNTLLKMHFCAGVPRSFSSFTIMPLDYTEHPGKNWGLAILPLAVGAARLAGIRRGRRRSRPGKGSGSTRSSPRAQGWPRFKWRQLRRARSAALGGAGRYGLASGETATRAAQGVARGVAIGH